MRTYILRCLHPIAAGVLLVGAIGIATAGASAATVPAQRYQFTPPATLPLSSDPIVVPERGCIKIVYTAPVFNAITGAIESWGTTITYAFDKATTPTDANCKVVYASYSGQDGSQAGPDSGLTYRGTWSPYCSFNQQIVAAWVITAADVVEAIVEGYDSSGAPVYWDGPQTPYGSGVHEYRVTGGPKSPSYEWSSVAFYDTTNHWI